jgi:abortive infection bacteriophage resistance protein
MSFPVMDSTGYLNKISWNERELLSEIVIQAWDDITKGRNSQTSTKNKREALAWFLSKKTGQFTFLGICEIINIEPTPIITNMKQFLEDQASKRIAKKERHARGNYRRPDPRSKTRDCHPLQGLSKVGREGHPDAV